MCLSVPMKVEEIRGSLARCSAMGQQRWADLMLLGDQVPKIGDYVQIHLKFVQRIVPEREAREAYEMFDEIIEHLDAPKDK